MFTIRIFAGVLLTIAIGALTPSRAGELVSVDVAIDQAQLVRLSADAAQIIIGNPLIADVAAQAPRLLVVTGKSYGITNLIALDRDDREIYSAKLSVREAGIRQVTLYKGTARQTYHCAPECQRTLSIGDDKSQFEQLAESVSKKFGVVNSAIGGN
jgi:hypothetical protein